jgi:tryptophan-rich sensory protein
VFRKGVIFLTVKTNINLKRLIISVLIPLAVGGIASLISNEGFKNYSENAVKPPLSPSNWVFPVVWTALYILMGISSYLVYEKDKSEARQPLAVYAIQLFLNFMWPVFFFSLNAYLFSFIWIVLLWAFTLAMIILFYSISKTAGLIQIPYILWLTFAAYLNLSVYLLN